MPVPEQQQAIARTKRLAAKKLSPYRISEDLASRDVKLSHVTIRKDRRLKRPGTLLGTGIQERLLFRLAPSGRNPVIGDRMPRVTELATEVAAKIRPLVVARFQQGRQWVGRNPRTALWVAGITVAVALLVLLITHWNPYKAQHEAFTPLFTLTAGLAIAGVTLMRHFAQTEADRQRRITESFSKAIEQLGSDKLEVRLGGIYALERISQESTRDYWTVMENLTAFVRERTQRTEAERTARPIAERIAKRAYFRWEDLGQPDGRAEEIWAWATEEERHGEVPATDVAAVLTVIRRRHDHRRALEAKDNRVFDFRRAVLRRADLGGEHLKGALLTEAHLESASLVKACLEDAFLDGARLRRANLVEAHLERAQLVRARLGYASMGGAYLQCANLERATLAARRSAWGTFRQRLPPWVASSRRRPPRR